MEMFAAVPAALGRSLPQILAESGRFGLFILAITFVMSVMTWAVVWDRARLYKKLRERGAALKRLMVQRGVTAATADAERFLPSIEASLLLETRHFIASRGAEGVLMLDDPTVFYADVWLPVGHTVETVVDLSRSTPSRHF